MIELIVRKIENQTIDDQIIDQEISHKLGLSENDVASYIDQFLQTEHILLQILLLCPNFFSIDSIPPECDSLCEELKSLSVAQVKWEEIQNIDPQSIPLHPSGLSISLSHFDENQPIHDLLKKLLSYCKIQHPNLVKVRGYCISPDSKVCIISDHYGCNNVDDYRSLTWKQRLKGICAINDALKLFEEANLSHGRVDYSNIFLDNNKMMIGISELGGQPKDDLSALALFLLFLINGEESDVTRGLILLSGYPSRGCFVWPKNVVESLKELVIGCLGKRMTIRSVSCSFERMMLSSHLNVTGDLFYSKM